MSSAPGPQLWIELFVVIGLGTALITGSATLMCRFLQAASGRRAIWQAATLCVMALVLGELTGSAPLFARLLRLSMAPSMGAATSDAAVPSTTAPPSAVAESAEWSSGAASDLPDVSVSLVESLSNGDVIEQKESSIEGPPPHVPDSEGSVVSIPTPPLDVATPALSVERVEPLQAESSPAGVHFADDPEAVAGLWWPGLVWIAGAAPLFVRALVGWAALFLLCRRRAEISTAGVAARARALAGRLGLAGDFKVLRTPGLSGPLAAGIVRPTIVIPEGFENEYDPAQQQAMLLHELAHLRGGDPAWHVLADVVTIILWWHPLAWWSRHELRVASEFAADEASVVVDGGPDALAASLVRVGARLTRPGFSGLARVAGSGFRSALGRRVERLLRLSDEARGPRDPLPAARWSKLALAALGLALVGSSVWLRPIPLEANPASHQTITGKGESAMKSSLFPLWKRSVAGLTFLAVLGAGAADSALDEQIPNEEQNAPLVDLSVQAQNDPPVVDLSDDPPEGPTAADPLLENRELVEPGIQVLQAEKARLEIEKARRLASGFRTDGKAVQLIQKQLDQVDGLLARQAPAQQAPPGTPGRTSDELKRGDRIRSLEDQVKRLSDQLSQLSKQLETERKTANERKSGRKSGRKTANEREQPQAQQQKLHEQLQQQLQRRQQEQPRPEPRTIALGLPSRALDTSERSDLIGLATKLADAMGDARLARLRFRRISELGGQNLVSQDETDIARINLETAEQKIKLLREIAMAYLSQAESQLVFLHGELDTLRKYGKPDESGLRGIESRMRSAEAVYSVLRSLASLKEPGAANAGNEPKSGRARSSN